MRKLELEIIAMSGSISQSNNFAVVLGEVDGTRRLPVIIGNFEAQAIAVAIERMVSSRPLTHDLIKNIFDAFQIDLKEVVINDLSDGIFFAQLVCWKDGELYEIDSRTSDALALAVRFNCPIYTYDFVMDAAGIEMEEPNEAPAARRNPRRQAPKQSGALSSYPMEALQKLLEEVLSAEDYERAAQIRDEIRRRQEQG